MNIGIPKEVKNHEYRVGMLPTHVQSFVHEGHNVFVENGAGFGIGIADAAYKQAGATLMSSADELWGASQMIIKVKEPTPEEYHRFKANLIICTFLHLAADKRLTEQLCRDQVSAVAYETIQLDDGTLPLLHPMSEASGRLAPQIGAHHLEKNSYGRDGKGILLGGLTGVGGGHVVILGAGVVGKNAAKIAIGLGARVTILDVNLKKLATIQDLFGSVCQTLVSQQSNLVQVLPTADLLISGVLVAGAKSPTVITKEMIQLMSPGSVVIDVAIDQGGSIETIQPTTHDNPIFLAHDVIHYGVTNIPGCVPTTTTQALTSVTFPYALQIAQHGLHYSITNTPSLARGLNTFGGFVTHPEVAAATDQTYKSYQQIITQQI